MNLNWIEDALSELWWSHWGPDSMLKLWIFQPLDRGEVEGEDVTPEDLEGADKFQWEIGLNTDSLMGDPVRLCMGRADSLDEAKADINALLGDFDDNPRLLLSYIGAALAKTSRDADPDVEPPLVDVARTLQKRTSDYRRRAEDET